MRIFLTVPNSNNNISNFENSFFISRRLRQQQHQQSRRRLRPRPPLIFRPLTTMSKENSETDVAKDPGSMSNRPTSETDVEGHRVFHGYGVHVLGSGARRRPGSGGSGGHRRHKRNGLKRSKDSEDESESELMRPSDRVHFILGEDDTDGGHESHPLFSELAELVSNNEEMEWRETARWIKFEEDVEEGGNRWSKPHVGTISLHLIFELRSCILNGTVLLDLEASSLDQIADLMLESMVQNNRLSADVISKVKDALLRRHRHQHERRHGGDSKNRLPIIRSLTYIGRNSSRSMFGSHSIDFPESIRNFTQFQNNKTSHKNQICTSVLMKNCNINLIEINLLETPLFMKSTTKISMDPMTELHQFLQMNQKIEQKIKCHKNTSSLKGFETDQIEPMFPALINLTLPFKDIKRSLSFSSLDDIKHLPYDLYARVMDILFIKNHIDEKVADEKAMLKIQTMKMNGFNDSLFTTVKSDPLNSAIDINCEKKKKRRKNQKRRNRKKKNRDKCKSFLIDEKKLVNDKINDGPEPEAVNTQSLVEPPLKTNITKSADAKKDCFISKFFSFPCNDELSSVDWNDELSSIDWNDEEYENDDVSINCGIELSAKDFLFDSPTNNDFDDENIWVEPPEEWEFREKIQAMVAKANEEWDAISLPSDCNDKEVGVFQMEIKSPQITRHVRFVEEPVIWLITDLED
ncbi:Sodium bicarbonate cotransporter 3 [Dermatophagoides farinae]|uniref:Sodium bicarbonate cotransporter 3 n=1 Tax=Dermatophagoides farinae TaxID=6954 RepID=A0A922HWX6_DERFA|nr:Sodium bicarbonate cotransporter 3 [Dermatophagoides farinae]